MIIHFYIGKRKGFHCIPPLIKSGKVELQYCLHTSPFLPKKTVSRDISIDFNWFLLLHFDDIEHLLPDSNDLL